MSLYEELSAERKAMQDRGDLPEWVTTGGWQMLKANYLSEGETLKQRYRSVADTAAKHLAFGDANLQSIWSDNFFELMWKGWLALSTPVLSNMGTNKGMPVSCAGNYVEDSIEGFYDAYKETAILTKHGFGTSSYLGDVRPRGTPISSGGKASGVLDVITSFVDDMKKVSQGTARRGAWAGYLEMDHGDFHEACTYLLHYPDNCNMGWIMTDAFIARLKAQDQDAVERWQRACFTRARTGKGYLHFVDKVNRRNPLPLKVKASNLCMEITLPSDEGHTFTCVLSSMNLAKYDEWRDTNAVYMATVFLDCVASEFIELAKGKRTFSKAVAFTTKARALGLGALGYHTLLQSKSIPFESLEAHMLNIRIFKDIKARAVEASTWLAKVFGEPEWMKGTGRRNSHLLAIAPNTSSALICGGVSQGIEPVVSNVFVQPTSTGDINRISPEFLALAKKHGKFDQALIDDLVKTQGSVQHLDWLSDHEKSVFLTAYELNQYVILRKASARQPSVCQAQSINLFASDKASEVYLSDLQAEAVMDEGILGLYYLRSAAGVTASTGECVACEG